MDLNVVAITGRLAADPERYATGNGTDVTMLRIAIGRPRRRGQERSEADFVDVAVWEELARLADRYLAKGNRVGVTGRLQQRTWTTPEGLRSRLQVVAAQLQFIDYKDSSGQAGVDTDSAPPPPAAEPPATASQTLKQVVIQADGGSRGNPGPAGVGVVLATPDGEVLAELAEPIGWATNNVAEYRAVIAGLKKARSLGACEVHVKVDSQLVARQLTGAWQVNTAALQSLFAEARRLVDEFEQVSFEQVPREDNRRADELANQAMNRQGQVARPDQATGEETAEQHPAPAETSAATDAGAAEVPNQ